MNVLSGDRIRELFAALDQELAERAVVGEVGLLGGAVMCLVFQERVVSDQAVTVTRRGTIPRSVRQPVPPERSPSTSAGVGLASRAPRPRHLSAATAFA